MSALTETFATAAQVARRVLTTSFRSPVALVFLGVFLVAVNLSFFTLSGYFARGLADVRPLFQALPLLLLLLVAALTMGGWAEERKLGTLEILLTLPVRPWGLVLGKWAAGVGLVALALALTWPLPLLIGALGPIDPGPVIGGYLGALLVGGAWVAIGLCVSSRTDNQIIALIVTLVVGGVLLLVGDDALTALFASETADILRGLGAGSRFDSVERGVIDLRDMLYYGGIIATALALNVAFLELPRVDQAAEPKRVAARWLHVALIATNAALLVLWLTPISGLRLDLTADGNYSLAPITRQTLRSLDEPLYIDGYLSSRTHPLLGPVVPQIRDTLREIDQVGGGRVKVTLADPATDDDLAAEIGQNFGIESVPFGVADRQAQSVVNAYFHVLVRYGDQHEVLSLDDLVEFDASIAGADLEVRLADLEYALMRAIRKVTRSFQSLDAQLARLPEDSAITLYATPDTAPADFQEGLRHLRSVSQELAQRSNGRLTFQEIAPTPDQAQDLATRYGVRPLAADIFGQQRFYAHLVIAAGDKVQRMMPAPESTEADVRRSLEAAIRRASPGQLVKVGLLTELPEGPPPNPQLPPQFQPPPPRKDYQSLRQSLLLTHDVEEIDLADGAVPDHLDVLVVGKAGMLTPQQQWAIDQYLMRGGAVIALAGARAIKIDRMSGMSTADNDAGLRELLASWGVTVDDALVYDPNNAPFPMPVREQRGMYQLERIKLIPYPLFPEVRGAGFASHPAVAGVTGMTFPWASPVQVAGALPEGVEATVIARSSEGSWINAGRSIEPDFKAWPDVGFGAAVATPRGRHALAVALVGAMPSHFADRPSPVWEGDGEAATGRTIPQASPDARLAVVGSSELVSDLILRLADSPSGELHRGNHQFFLNLLDWAVEDTDLLAIRSAGAFARTLPRMEPETTRTWELTAYAGALLPLLLFGLLPLFIGRRLPPELARLDAAPRPGASPRPSEES